MRFSDDAELQAAGEGVRGWGGGMCASVDGVVNEHTLLCDFVCGYHAQQLLWTRRGVLVYVKWPMGV
jgi:hypothetical protein